jgi:hypothetical protein
MGDRDSVMVHLEYIRKAQDETNQHLRALNGRTRKIEQTAAVHSWAIGLGGAGSLAVFVWMLSRL